MPESHDEILEELSHHIGLPPRLPGTQNEHPEKINLELMRRLLDAVRKILKVPGIPFFDEWTSLLQSLESSKKVNLYGGLSKESIISALQDLQNSEFVDDDDKTLIFEVSEASARSEDVLASKNALLWDFPTSAVTIPFSLYHEHDCENELAEFLEKASKESVKYFAAHSLKAKSMAYESRNTVDPAIISVIFMTILAINGKQVYPPLLRKRVRDDVCWNSTGERPWRRSPFWLLLRVAVQRHLCLTMGPELGRLQFKLLMCLFHANFLSDCLVVSFIDRGVISHLHKKLVVRIEKLRSEEEDLLKNSTPQYQKYKTLRIELEQEFNSSVEQTFSKLLAQWNSHKKSQFRKLCTLPTIAPQHYLNLKMLNSSLDIKEALKPIKPEHKFKPWEFDERFHQSFLGAQPKILFANKYFKLAELESEIERDLDIYRNKPNTSSQTRCLVVAEKIKHYLKTVGNAYDKNPEQKSRMLLLVLELWIDMDRCAIQCHDLIKEYSSGIPQKITNVLQLSRLKDLERLQQIRSYLKKREYGSTYSSQTIFDQPNKNCFAVRFYDNSTEDSDLRLSLFKIERDALQKRNNKEKEWKEKNEEYARLVAKESSMEHCNPGMEHNRGRCGKCYQQRVIKRFEIIGHEWPLPADTIILKTVLFELHCPIEFASYRDVTWKILTDLASISSSDQKATPKFFLRDVEALSNYGDSSLQSKFTLASKVKSFTMTHFGKVKFPNRLTDICVPNGARFAYYDTENQLWSSQNNTPSFAHHCNFSLPADSFYSSLQHSPEFLGDTSGPTSYEIVASRINCPSGGSVQEFLTLQSLFTGFEQRWLQILIELASTNINFSTESVASILNTLALRIGPYDEGNIRGIVHQIFVEPKFSNRLMDWIHRRMNGISAKNKWREVHCMEILITLLLRVFELATPEEKKRGVELIENAREITMKWLSKLRSDEKKASSAEAIRTRSHYTLWTALLCRRTFTIFVDKPDRILAHLKTYIESSISLQECLSDELESLTPLLKAALVRDLKMVWSIRSTLRESLNLEVLMSAIALYYPLLESQSLQNDTMLKFLPAPAEWWVEVRDNISRDDVGQIASQKFHFNILTGHLMVNGKSVGKLPEEWKECLTFKYLFGDRALSIYTSSHQDMEYMLKDKIDGNQIHFGKRNEKKIVQIINDFGEHMEYLSPEIFTKSGSSDLPSYLIEKCVHWLNLGKQLIEIRRHLNHWRYRPQNWLINLRDHSGTLHLSDNNIYDLVDPHSRLFKGVADIFKDFENPNEIVVYQPRGGYMAVRLPRLELNFKMNGVGFLECMELSSEIDPNQDAGTWYGLKSMLVLRDITRVKSNQNRWSRVERESRSILVPTGKVSISRNGLHVDVKVVNEGRYARFIINEALGRLDVVDPNHRYLKAFYHACTSFVIPDNLTSRTGTEEAFHCLNSGYCQPATPLLEEQENILQHISNLTPQRVYYPPNMKSMQVTNWNHTLTASIQHDGYRSVVKRIYEESQSLSNFYSERCSKLPDTLNADQHLNMRNLVRRNLYERMPDLSAPLYLPDTTYSGYAIKVHASRIKNVRTCLNLFRNWTLPLPRVPDLAKVLQGWACFDGFSKPFNKFLLSEIFEDNLPQYWGSLVNTFRSSNHSSKYKLMFLLGIVSFRESKNIEAIIVLIAFAISDKLRELEPPQWPSYSNFRKNEKPTASILISFMGLSHENFFKKQEVDREEVKFAEFLLKQWPCAVPTALGSPKFKYIDVAKAMDYIYPEWLRMYQNLELSQYLSKVQAILNEICSLQLALDSGLDSKAGHQEQMIPGQTFRKFKLPKTVTDLLDDTYRQNGIITPRGQTSMRVVDNSARVILSEKLNAPHHGHHKVSRMGLAPEIEQLEKIVSTFTSSQSTIETQYAEDLTKSLLALQNKRFQPRIIPNFNSQNLSRDIDEAKNSIRQKLRFIQHVVEDSYSQNRVKLLKQAGLWPCVTPVDLLESLRSISKRNMTSNLKDLIVGYAVSITNLQRLYRIQDADLVRNSQRLNQELENQGHENWDPKIQTDWLLLEIDANILIRPDQVNVANATISPSSGKNSALQMNMGQGKTSCIMPMAAATLADGSNLLRVIVPRALLVQTLQLLQTRLGGLVGRRIKHIPFSRKISTRNGLSEEFFRHLKEIQMASGIFVTLPDHILSFQLSGQQALSDGRLSEAKDMLQAQKWISKKSRDIIDECDEILSLRTQLIYPSGTQKIVDGHPFRWEIIQSLFEMTEYHLSAIQSFLPNSITVTSKRIGSFPFLCFVHEESEESLISRLIDDICSGRSHIIPTYSLEDQSYLKDFISKNNVSDAVVQKIESLSPENPKYLKSIYLLRGLFVQKIFITCLKKRWNVQYGLHPFRDPIAVPFHAKGCPSDQSEWGHPDVAIILTCLSFYYQGINVNQFRQTLEYVLKAGDPVQAYGRLIEGSSLPEVFQDWTSINLEDRIQLNELWKYLYLSVNVINFFLNIFVFPQHAKQFERKLQASSWDIPSSTPGCYVQNGKNILPLSTGFSGTNDWKRLLPLTISQQDLPILSHTNAEVLTYLLQKRNSGYFLAADSTGRRLSECDLLRKITENGVTVLIDAGAQIMEMTNHDLAKAWLDIHPNAVAALYFDQENRPQILYNNGRHSSLYSSTFADNLQGCLVYLDQAHTRGTDLKLPADAKGALSLGPGQTKDHTVQGKTHFCTEFNNLITTNVDIAAMRLRQLATTQTVIFFAPPEVHRSIINLQKNPMNNHVTSIDIVFWLLKQTCAGIELLLPLYAAQGVEFLRRSQAALNYPKLCDSESRDRSDYLKIIRKVEDFTLEELYGIGGKKKEPAFSNPGPMIANFVKELKVRCRGFLSSEKMNGNETLQEVEQEREVANEVQTVRQLQSPVIYTPLKFPSLHAEIRSFVKTGLILKNATAYEPAFKFIARTSIGQKYNVTLQGTSEKLYVSIEFDRTVQRAGGSRNEFQRVDHLNRPVHWILWSPVSEVAMIIIPEEVETVISILKEGKCAVHLLSYAAPVTRKMLQFNDLSFFNLPPLPPTWQAPNWLRIELGVLSGRLYFDQFEYIPLLEFFAVKEIDGKIVEINEVSGSEAIVGNPRIERKTFVSKPMLFLQEWLAQRRPGQDFSHTPMGHICQGRPLLPDHPFFSREVKMSAIPEDDEDGQDFYGSSEEQPEDDNGNYEFDVTNHKQGEEPIATEFKEESLLQFAEMDED
ncbi:hypothetical protein K3495_g5425 [Podosphaera aphanis]|nr:hypothetical protein K3495_g5425 [Podosphaera aphanis]